MDIGVFGARAIPSTYSGYETFLSALLPELARRGHRVTMYCRTDHFGRPSMYRGVRLVPLPAIDTTRLSTLSHGLLAAIAARSAGHDVVLVVNVANVPYCIASRITRQRVVMNTDGQEWLRGKWGVTARRYFKWCAGRARFAACALVADSNEMKRIYVSEFGSDSTVIPYASIAWQDVGLSETLAEFDVEPGQFVVVAARLNPENNVDRVAAAYARSSLSMPLLVLGVANYTSETARHIRELADRDDRIRPIGHVADRRTFGALLHYAKAYVHGHSVGGMNPSLVEAMSAGALVIALSTPFNVEVLGEAGEYFDFDGDSLVNMLDSLAQLDEHLESKYRALASTRAEERYALAEVASTYEYLLTKVARLESPWSQVQTLTAWDAVADGAT